MRQRRAEIVGLDDANETLDYGTRRAAADREGGNIVKSKVVLGVLAVMGILALSATAAQAGAGGRPSPLTSFFVCHSINGDDPGKVVDVESPVFGPDRQSVRIGNGTLACAWAKLFSRNPDGTTTPIDPNPSNTHEQLKCYTVSVARKTSGPTRYHFTDELFGPEPEQDIQASELRYLCAPATLGQ